MRALPFLILLVACGDDGTPPPPPADSGTASDAGTTIDASLPPEDSGGSDAGSTVSDCYEDGVALGNVSNPELTEISGLVASRAQPRVVFVHNDSGEPFARVFAIRDDGANLGVIAMPGAGSRDWEDMAIAPSATGYDLYLGDIGDNSARTGMGTPRTSITVYRIPEPTIDPDGAPVDLSVDTWEALELTYEDRPHDAEILLVDPTSGDLFIITKEADGMSGVFRSPAPLSFGGSDVLSRVGQIDFGTPAAPGTPMSTGGDVSPGGDAILVRTYSSVLFWARAPGTALEQAFSVAATELPSVVEMQGEAVGFAGDSTGYFTISEGGSAPVNFFAACD